MKSFKFAVYLGNELIDCGDDKEALESEFPKADGYMVVPHLPVR